MDVRDMSAEELRSLVREAVAEALDPDYGLSVKPEVLERLASVPTEGLLTIEEVRQRLARKRA